MKIITFTGMAVATLFLLCASLMAQTFPDDYTRVILPIAIATDVPVLGALDSQWATSLAITNTGSEPVSVIGYVVPCSIECTPPPVPPGVTFFPKLGVNPGEASGAFIWIQRGRESDVHVALRVHDITREGSTRGTELPVVPESEFLTAAVLEDIPLTSGFRSNLRIYDLDESIPRHARIKLYAVNVDLEIPDAPNTADQLVFDQVISYSPIGNVNGPGMIYLDLSSLPELSGISAVRAEISAVETEQFTLWALASTTNNSNQQITTISPR